MISVIAATLLSNSAYAQETDSSKQAKVNYFSKDLGTTSKNAEEVVLIINQYKEAVKRLINDQTLTEDARKTKFKQLIDDKHQKLKQILTEQQLQRIVSSSERTQLITL